MSLQQFISDTSVFLKSLDIFTCVSFNIEKEMATHSSILAWRIPWTEEPDGPQSMELTKSWTWLSN